MSSLNLAMRRGFSAKNFLTVKEPAKLIKMAAGKILKPHYQKHLTLPQSYFIELKEKLEYGEDKDAVVEQIMPEVKSHLEKGLSSRQIYKLLHPIAMLDTEASKASVDLILKGMIEQFRTDNYSTPMFFKVSTNPALHYFLTYGKGFYDGSKNKMVT